MSWIEHHENSERLASQAQVTAREGRRDDALALYARAADAEDRALADLDPSKTRTLGLSAVSAASLHYKANRLGRAEAVALRWLEFKELPTFAKVQLESLLSRLDRRSPAVRREGSTTGGQPPKSKRPPAENARGRPGYPSAWS